MSNKSFFKGEMHPVAYTVGELISHLQQLPSCLKIRHESKKGVELVVYNMGSYDSHLGFHENEK